MKRTLSLLACVLIALSVLLTGCGSSDSSSSGSDTGNADTSSASAGNDTSSIGDADTTGTDDTEAADETLQAIVDEAQSSVDTLKASLGDSVDVRIEARGQSLVYTFQYLTDIGDTSLITDSLEENIEAQSSTYETILSQLQTSGVESPSVVVEYLDMDGNEIYSKEFK